MKLINFLIVSIGILIFSNGVVAQVGVGTITPDASAELEVYSTNKGFLPPRVSLTGTTDIVTISSPANGLLVYNNATAGISPNNVTTGYYFFDGTKWTRLITPADNSSNVSGTVGVINGGTGTTNGSISGTGALTFSSGGTNQNIALQPSGSGKTILSGNVGIGNNSPSSSLEVGNSAGTNPGEIILDPCNTSDEGGQIVLKKSVTGSNKDWNIDQFVNISQPRLRIFPDLEIKGISIMENGNVAVGYDASTLNDKLTVIGSAKITENLNAKGNYYMVAGLSANTSITNTNITIPMTDKDDPNNWWDGTNYRFQPTVSGNYFVSAMVHFSMNLTSSGTIQCNMQILKNGDNQSINQVQLGQGTVNVNLTRSQTATAIIYMNGTTDYVTLTGYTNNSSSVIITGDASRIWTKMEAYKLN